MQNIKTIFNREVMPLIDIGKYNLAEKKLKLIYMENYHELKNLEDKRLIVYNLAWLLAKQNRYDESKFYLLDLKNEMEQNKQYVEEYENKYCNLLMLYIEVDQDITKEEYCNTCKMLNKYYKKIGAKEQELITECNLAIVEKDMDKINEILNYTSNNRKMNFIRKEILSKINKGEEYYVK